MNILVVGAHHDDCEIGCAGTIAKFTSEGHRVFGLTLTDSATHYPERKIYRTVETAIKEATLASEVIGLERIELDYPPAKNGMLNYDTLLMREIESLIVKNKIQIVFSHWQHDLNTDHAHAAQMTIVASRHVSNLLQYRSNWHQGTMLFNGNFYIDITSQVDKKIKALGMYQGEIASRGKEWMESFIHHNKILGLQIGVGYAEVFEPVRVKYPIVD